MSLIRMFAAVFGVAFLVIGICGFVPPLLSPAMPGHTDQLMTHAFDGRLFGLFHVNAIHSGAHILFGVLGLIAASQSALARGYAWLVCLAYAGLAVMGLFPATNTLFGMAPMHGNDVWLHVVLSAAALVAAVALPGRTLAADDGLATAGPAPTV